MANARTIALFALFALCASVIHADEPPPFSPVYETEFMISISGNALPADSIVQVQYSTERSRGISTAIVAKKDGRATLYSKEKAGSVSLSYDDPSTPALDGIWSGSPLQVPNITIAGMQPLSDVAGVIFKENGFAAQGAFVELACPNGFAANTTTNENGRYSFARVPAGKCMLTATLDDEFTQREIALSTGEFATQNAQMAKPFPFLLAAAFCIIVLGIIAYYLHNRKTQAPGQEGKMRAKPSRKAIPPNVSTPRQLDLLATLDSKEKKIVEYVQHHAPSSVRTSRMRRDLLIPKTSLTRTLSALERKQFLKIEKIGSRQFAMLHEFYKAN